MASFFVTEPDGDIQRYGPNDTIGPNGYARIGNYGTNGGEQGPRPGAILSSVQIETQGIGLLRRCTAQFKTFSADQFNSLYNQYALGNSFTVEYGQNQGPAQSIEFRTYDFSFEMTKLGGYDFTIKGVAPGDNIYEEIDLLYSDNIPDREFIAEAFFGSNARKPVANVFDYIEWLILQSFDIELGAAIQTQDDGYFALDIADNAFRESDRYLLWENKFRRDSWQEKFGDISVLSAAGLFGWVSLAELLRILQTAVTIPLVGRSFDWTTYGDINLAGFTDLEQFFSPDPLNVLWNIPGSSTTEFFNSDGNMILDIGDVPRLEPLGNRSFNPGNLFISVPLLRKIAKDVTEQYIRDTNETESINRAAGDMPFKKFFTQLFSAIRTASSGMIDLDIDQKEDKPDIIFIVNKKSNPPIINTIQLNPFSGQYGIRDMQLSGNIPKTLQAKYFGNSPDVSGVRQGISRIIGNLRENARNISIFEGIELFRINEPKTTKQEILNGIVDSDFTGDGVTAAQQHVKNYVDQALESQAIIAPPPLPLELSFKINGGAGLRFGNPIAFSGLPDALSGNDTIFWTVSETTDVINGADFYTEVKCIARIKGLA